MKPSPFEVWFAEEIAIALAQQHRQALEEADMMAKYSKRAQAAIGRTIRTERKAGVPAKQAVAIGIGKARARGLKVPKRRGRK